MNEGRLTIYNGVDSNGSGIALPSSDIPPFSKLIEITDAWAQTIILANNNITIPAGSTSGGIELVASIAENAEIPEYISIKLKNDTEYSGQFYMNTTAISTQEELDNFFNGGFGPGVASVSGSFNSNYDGPENQPAEYINIQEGDALNYSVDLSENEISNLTFELIGGSIPDFITLDASSGKITGVPDDLDVGQFEFFIRGSGENSEEFSQKIKLTINNVNEAPDFETLSPPVADEDAIFTYQLTANDEDEITGFETLTYTAVSTLPSWLQFILVGFASRHANE